MHPTQTLVSRQKQPAIKRLQTADWPRLIAISVDTAAVLPGAAHTFLQVIGSSLGVLAAHSAGEGNQPLRQLANLLVLSVVPAAATTAACSWLVGDILQNVRASDLSAFGCCTTIAAVWVRFFARVLHRRQQLFPETSTQKTKIIRERGHARHTHPSWC